MVLNVESENKVYTIKISGRIDTLTAPALQSEFEKIEADADKVIFDMTEAEYISSAGLRVILSAHKTMMTQGTMKIINVNEIISEIFSVTGFTDVLDIE